ncbi:hypothetical protein Smp_166510, partial [Schistosoma mansoni]|uniref:hypothetical protein n=1 Tax=Schistosoma mansoni TaxID=6183 RepID=UPI00022C87C2
LREIRTKIGITYHPTTHSSNYNLHILLESELAQQKSGVTQIPVKSNINCLPHFDDCLLIRCVET